TGEGEGLLEELLDGVRLARGKHVVLRLVRLEHAPRAVHVVTREPPVTLGLEVAEAQLVLLAAQDRADGTRDLARDERRAAAWGRVIGEDPGEGVHAVRLPAVARDSV